MRTPIAFSFRAGITAFILSIGIPAAHAETEIVSVEDSPVVVKTTERVEMPVTTRREVTVVEDSGVRYLVPAREEVELLDANEGDRVRIDLTLPGERRVVGVRRFTVSRSPEVIQIHRPRPVVVEEVRAFAPPLRSFREVVQDALVEHDLRHTPVPVYEYHHDDDDDDDD